ncbi:MAG: sigma-54 dependent transcriptional regulator [Pseudomonadota bacterium]
MKKPVALIIDDNDGVREALSMLLSLHDIDAVDASGPDEGIAALRETEIDIVIQDMNFAEEKTSGAEGIQLFKAIRKDWPDVPIILLTAWTNLETAVELVKAGAADYLGKPWDDHRLITTTNNLLALQAERRARQQIQEERAASRAALADRYDLCGTVYQSDPMHEVVSLACRVARSDVPVLITGPNGAGKEKLAEIVQSNSAVADGPFVRVNVGGLPSELLEAELFGAEAGAYTGLNKRRIGRFEMANGGTLFLDEIGNLSADGQSRLLRVLQSGEYERLGSSVTRQTQVRVISATNADLPGMIAEGRFREDLYYRLNVIELQLPALSDRPGDVPLLAEALVGEDHTFSAQAMRMLEQQSWPGNVRELQNLVTRARVLATNRVIDVEALGLRSLETSALPEPTEADIRRALAQHHNIVARAARELGISRQAFYRRMVKYGLHDGPDGKPE